MRTKAHAIATHNRPNETKAAAAIHNDKSIKMCVCLANFYTYIYLYYVYTYVYSCYGSIKLYYITLHLCVYMSVSLCVATWNGFLRFSLFFFFAAAACSHRIRTALTHISNIKQNIPCIKSAVQHARTNNKAKNRQASKRNSIEWEQKKHNNRFG